MQAYACLRGAHQLHPGAHARAARTAELRRAALKRTCGASLLPLRESATLQSTLPNCKADAYPGEAHNGPRPVAEFWKAHDAWKAGQVK